MELVWDIYYAVLKDGWWIVDQYIYIYTERLFGAAMKNTFFDKTLFLVLRFLKATSFVVFVFYFFHGLACFLLCFRTRYAGISLASYLD